jgi:hypothetical protein
VFETPDGNICYSKPIPWNGDLSLLINSKRATSFSLKDSEILRILKLITSGLQDMHKEG